MTKFDVIVRQILNWKINFCFNIAAVNYKFHFAFGDIKQI